jgi:sialate O-acetylesterase
MKNLVISIIFLASMFVSVNAREFKVADIFSDEMVLQQKTQTPVWGWDKPGKNVSVSTSWNNKSYSTKTDSQGKWKVMISTPSAGGPYRITISGDKKVTLKDVWIGEVWYASGQSNMSMPLKGYFCQPVSGSNDAIINSLGKNIHFINIPIMGAYKPLEEFSAKWVTSSPETTAECSSVAWFFADFLNKNLDVPVGIINASYGGSNVEAWMTSDACNQFTDIKVPELKDYTDPNVNNVPTVLYNGMVNPVVGYAIKGMIWYQGESNIFNVPRYAPSVAAMVSEYRRIWNVGEFPFYYAQIAPYEYKCWNFFTPQWPEISAYQREAQLKCMKLISNSAMAVLMDVGESYNIHPTHKKEVGERLAMLAATKTYGKKGYEAESPEYENMEIDGNKIIIHFSKQFNGLTSFGKTLELFEIAGENRVFQKADAYINENNGTVVCTSKLVDKPVAVRYAFRNDVKGELFGTGGLPVSSFRTDKWE